MSRCKYVAAIENTARIDSAFLIVVSEDDLNNVEMHKPALVIKHLQTSPIKNQGTKTPLTESLRKINENNT